MRRTVLMVAVAVLLFAAVAPPVLAQGNGRIEGRVTRGLFQGARVWGIDPFLIRRDGVGIIDVPKTISGDGYHVYEHVRAYALPPEGLEMPSLEALLEPGFEWPDIPFPIQGSSTFRTGVPHLAWLNRAVARVDGWASMATGKLVIETGLLKPVEPGPSVVPVRGDAVAPAFGALNPKEKKAGMSALTAPNPSGREAVG